MQLENTFLYQLIGFFVSLPWEVITDKKTVIRQVEQVRQAFRIAPQFHQWAKESQKLDSGVQHHSVGMNNTGFRRLNAQNHSL